MKTGNVALGVAVSASAALVALSMGMTTWGPWGALASGGAGLLMAGWDHSQDTTIMSSKVLWTFAGATPVILLWVIAG